MAKIDYSKPRKDRLLKEGFLQEEANYYSQFPINSLGMRKVRRFRQSEIRKAISQGIPQRSIPLYIRDSYKARNFILKDKPNPSLWNQALYSELEKPYRQRKAMAIPPKKYGDYIQAVSSKVSPEYAFRLVERIPDEQWKQRAEQYATLRAAHFSDFEAIKIVTTLTLPDKEGNRYLQVLDLNNPAWQEVIADRITAYNKQVKLFVDKGLTKGQAQKAAIREINSYYKRREGDTRKDPTPWDGLREIYRIKQANPNIDFVGSLRQRQQHYIKKKMPYRVK